MPLALQLLLGSIIVLSAFLMTVAAFQVFHILHDFSHLLKKLNKIADNTQTLSETSATPITAVNHFFSEVKTLVNETTNELVENTPDRVLQSKIPNLTSTEAGRRFFRRAGQLLRPS